MKGTHSLSCLPTKEAQAGKNNLQNLQYSITKISNETI